MNTAATELQFSLSELEEAGLLTDYQASEGFEPRSAVRLAGRNLQDAAAKDMQHGMHHTAPAQGRSDPNQDSVDELMHHIRPQLRLNVNTQPDTDVRPQKPLGSSASGEHSARSCLGTEFDRRQASNREHQRRFRQRQKVRAWIVVQCVSDL